MLLNKYPTFQVYMLVAEHRNNEKIFKAVLTARVASLSGLKPRLFPTYRISSETELITQCHCVSVAWR